MRRSGPSEPRLEKERLETSATDFINRLALHPADFAPVFTLLPVPLAHIGSAAAAPIADDLRP